MSMPQVCRLLNDLNEEITEGEFAMRKEAEATSTENPPTESREVSMKSRSRFKTVVTWSFVVIWTTVLTQAEPMGAQWISSCPQLMGN